MSSTMIEAMARICWEAQEPESVWLALPRETRIDWIDRARETVRVLHTAGYKVLPREPTREMNDAGMRWVTGKRPIAPAYRAMWDAAE